MDKENVARIVKELIRELGENPDREGLKETPERVAELYSEILSGYQTDAELDVSFAESSGYVGVKDIQFYSMCEHHLLPFFGKIQVVYEPDGRVFGVSKIIRLTQKYARRLQIQERMTTQIANELFQGGAKGVVVVVEARHLCMAMRGVKNGAPVITSAETGSLADPGARAAALDIIYERRQANDEKHD